MEKKSDLEQRARFQETARAFGADEDETAFKAKLAVIARQKPKEPTEALEASEAPQKTIKRPSRS